MLGRRCCGNKSSRGAYASAVPTDIGALRLRYPAPANRADSIGLARAVAGYLPAQQAEADRVFVLALDDGFVVQFP